MTAKKTNKRLMILTLMGVLSCSPLLAEDLGSDLKSAFNSMRMSNHTNPGVYKGQTATMLSAGGYTQRSPVRTYQLYSMQMPRVRAGCGGIDLFGGGFSYIDAGQFKAMLSNIASNAEGLAYKLAIDIVSAQLGNVLSEMEDIAGRFNNLQINSCEEATRMVGGAYNFVTGSNLACIQEKVRQGEDWGKANNACKAGGSLDQPQDAAAKDAAPFVGNLAWKAMVRSRMFEGNDELRWLFMTLTGTMIRRPETAGQSAVTNYFAPQLGTAKGKQIIETFMYGGNSGTSSRLSLMTCRYDLSEDGCIDMIEDDYMLDSSSAFYPLALSNLEALVDSLADDSPLRAEQESFLLATRLPVYTLVAAAYAAGGPSLANQHLSEYAELLARDAIYTYLDNLVADVQKILSSATSRGEDEQLFRMMAENIRQVRQDLTAVQQKHVNTFDQHVQLLQRYDYHKKILISRMPGNAFVPSQLMGTGE